MDDADFRFFWQTWLLFVGVFGSALALARGVPARLQDCTTGQAFRHYMAYLLSTMSGPILLLALVATWVYMRA